MRRLMKLLPVLIALGMLSASCDSNPGTTTLRLMMKTSADNAKTLYPQNSYDAAQYVVEGTYTGNANVTRNRFSVTTTSPAVSVEGIAVGSWHVYVEAENSRGDTIVEGEADIELKGSSGTHSVVLDTLVGTGSVNITVRWNVASVDDPQLHISLKPMDGDGETVSKDGLITSDYANGCAVYAESGIPAGSYLAMLSLCDGTTRVAGLVEAVRISANDTTEGTLSLDFSSEYTQYIGSLFLVTATGTPLEGEIIPTADNVVYSDEDTEISFRLKTGIEANTDYTIEWYLDGLSLGEGQTLVSSDNIVEIDPEPGKHVLSAVVSSSRYGSTGTASWFFTAMPKGDIGGLSLSYTVSQRSVGIFLSEGTSMGLLPDRRILFANPDVTRFYLCSITTGNMLRLEDYYTYLDFDWCNAVFEICSDPNFDIFAMRFRRSGHEGLAIMKYDPSRDEISVLQYKVGDAMYDMVFEGTYGHFMNGNEPMCAIGSIGFSVTDRDDGYVYIAQQNSTVLYAISIKDGEVECFVKGSKPALCDIIAVSQDYSEMSLFSSSATGFYTNSLETNSYGIPLGEWLQTNTDEYVVNARYIANGNVCLLTGSNFVEYTMSGHRGVSSRSVEDLSEVMCVPADGLYAYTADGDCNLCFHFMDRGASIAEGGDSMNCPIVSLVCLGDMVLAINTDGDALVYSIIRNALEVL